MTKDIFIWNNVRATNKSEIYSTQASVVSVEDTEPLDEKQAADSPSLAGMSPERPPTHLHLSNLVAGSGSLPGVAFIAAACRLSLGSKFDWLTQQNKIQMNSKYNAEQYYHLTYMEKK